MFSLPGGGTHGMTWAVCCVFLLSWQLDLIFQFPHNSLQWLVCSGFITVIALAVVQLLGASPTAAGVYKRAPTLPPSKHRAILSWVIGCKLPSCSRSYPFVLIILRTEPKVANILGNIASVASICWAVSSHIMAVAFVGSEFVGTRAETL